MKNKGFTLIELLVVISIIGILAGIILVGLNLARDRARDARVKEELNNLRIPMELYYNDHKAYSNGTDACASAGAIQILDDLNTFTAAFCDTSVFSGAGWFAVAHLPSDKRADLNEMLQPDAEWWCVDSKGASKKITIQEYMDIGTNYCQ